MEGLVETLGVCGRCLRRAMRRVVEGMRENDVYSAV